MKDLGLRGISRAKGPRTTVPGTAPDTRKDLVKRAFGHDTSALVHHSDRGEYETMHRSTTLPEQPAQRELEVSTKPGT